MDTQPDRRVTIVAIGVSMHIRESQAASVPSRRSRRLSGDHVVVAPALDGVIANFFTKQRSLAVFDKTWG